MRETRESNVLVGSKVRIVKTNKDNIYCGRVGIIVKNTTDGPSRGFDYIVELQSETTGGSSIEREFHISEFEIMK
jgi:hypothetical protein